MEAWIEIKAGIGQALDYVSLLSWKRGLKYVPEKGKTFSGEVAPLVEAWIEICYLELWICQPSSLLSWKRGLKYSQYVLKFPFFSRSSRGSVD